MNLEETLAEAIQKAVSAAESGADFLAAELPDYIQQLLLWHAVWSGIWFSFGIVLLVVLTTLQIKGWKVLGSNDNDLTRPQEEALVAALCLGLIVGGVIITLILATNIEWLKIWIAPKVFLVEYAARLVS